MPIQTHHFDPTTLSAKRAAACAVLSDDEIDATFVHPRVIAGLNRDMRVVVTETDDSGVDDLMNSYWDERADEYTEHDSNGAA